MSRLNSFVECRHEIARLYDSAFSSLPIIVPFQSSEAYSSYHLYPIRINESNGKTLQRDVYDGLWKYGIAANSITFQCTGIPSMNGLDLKRVISPRLKNSIKK